MKRLLQGNFRALKQFMRAHLPIFTTLSSVKKNAKNWQTRCARWWWAHCAPPKYLGVENDLLWTVLILILDIQKDSFGNPELSKIMCNFLLALFVTVPLYEILFFFSRQNEIILLGEKRTALSKLIIGNSQILFNTLVRVFARLYAKTCDGGSRARYAPPPS